ncbi:Chitooligosaccharide deacetylase, putative uricase [Devosia sp. LC5]|uniref:2-oxo-4-hydroxy-4-carboxy-5-ureidoimidazoline decarboxylase n=1 Tax=Devosia sp. LC5 TaxID=1502724 RepID=UPI0004E3291E|nr:2-oxo-4-hydroxy-4-carboxy-5-ureidoimidazoline decarboxylase [Devosia sp. LC5]KFC69916.1 Chitooligosaccharide deacetylase, putative uricase [Devosia sp. LC5]
MTIDLPVLDLVRLNTCTTDEFADLLGGVLEHAQYLVRRAADARPFADLDALHQAIMRQAEALPEAELVAFLSGHPEIAGSEARAGTMTSHSTAEQGRLNLGQLPEGEAARWIDLNARYRSQFGFPFIIRVAEHDYASLLSVFMQRLDNDRQNELSQALSEIGKISRHRLAARLSN